jgi:hypothetical protein
MSDILVSKSDVLDMITEIYEDGGFTDYAYYSRLWNTVDDMPSINAEDGDSKC